MIDRFPSGRVRSLEIVFFGTVLVILGFTTYPIIAALNFVGEGGSEGLLVSFAYLALGLTLVGSCVLFFGATKALTDWSKGETSGRPLPISAMVTAGFSKGRYSRLLLASSLAYGVFYAFASGIIVFQPARNFSEIYHVAIPSLAVATCCGAVGETPEAVVYVTQHLGVLLVPINLVLLFSLSWLVGLNASFAAFAYGFRTKNLGLSSFGGVAAFIGLFASCPTCAGLAIIALLGGAGTLSAAFFLGPLQTLFVGLSIPILVATPIISARSLRNSERRACPRP
jgi:hypothetical protein